MTAAGAGEHYLDHAATTPMRQCAIDAWVRHARDLNPGGQYAALEPAMTRAIPCA